ncbi:hypothetical protein [Pseudoalteromonas sp. MTN2-4]|uniref:hypothetical protein n=1 Tax=Pseudoalteromonas sp. MTN2-4 TaxID=3056555 RepID=UPI0036F33679
MRQSFFSLKIKIIHHIIGQAFELVKPIKQFITGALLLVQGQAYAQTHEQAEKQALTIDASTLWTTQQNSKQGFSSSLFSANIDLGLQLNTQQMIQFGIEYSQTPDEQGQAMFVLFESSADVLTTQDANEAGRAQVSTFYWQDSGVSKLPNSNTDTELTIGLLDIEGGVDTNGIANDENTQFLLPALVNNTSVYTPDYTLGIRYLKQPSENEVGYTLLVSRSEGLADKQGNYADVLTQGNSQLFIASEVKWRVNNSEVHLGAWKNQAEAATGMYSALQYHQPFSMGELALLVRAGLTKQQQSDAEAQKDITSPEPKQTLTHSTLSLASTWTQNNWQFGLGVATERQQAQQNNEIHQGEAWLKYTLHDMASVSVFNQWQWPDEQSNRVQARHSGLRLFLQF